VTDETWPNTRSVVVERELRHPPEKVWRALTQPHLIAEWLAECDFRDAPGYRFTVQINPQPDKSFIFDCEVTTVEPNKLLTYSWNAGGAGEGDGLRSTVTWLLNETPYGTLLRMEQSGFEPDQPNYYYGARLGWPQFIANLEQLLARAV
jgi:uncharacterized protein YndB with AHSA1/START domain